ncbi:N-acetylglucosamine-1-phosphodiester alpha-N-acetylglucosaminidase-like [Saccostrea cucullata]|uniref:N-acetylglucosamine-1-phosphodiester alpha-N-acetylglucosaminidase-like n=1 Tax=Saccostrea cuccullata TaxID=36930 RepID=UPI002ED59EB7
MYTREPLTCCSNFRRKGQECEVCFFGTFGKNCENTCPDGFYGRLCLEKCKCLSCDKVTGACQTTYSAKNIHSFTREQTIKTIKPWWLILVAVGLIVVGMSLGAFILKKCSRVNHPSMYFHTLNIQGRNALEQNTYDVLQTTTQKEQDHNKDLPNV